MIIIQILVVLLAVLVLAVAFLKSLQRDKDGDIAGFNVLPMLVGVAIAVPVFGFLGAFGQVPAGHRGVVLKFGAVQSGRVLDEGLYFVTPFVNSVELMDVQIHAHKAPAAAASKDQQNVDTEITLNYRVDPRQAATVYQQLRHDYEVRVISPSVQEAVKAVTAQFDAEKLITMRGAVRDQIEAALRDRLAKHGMLLDQISITNFKFSESYSNAIEAKQVATQEALKAENDLRRIKVEAEQRVAGARAEAEAIRIQADAIRAQGGAEYVNLKAIEKWNGQLPQWMAGNGAVPFVSLNSPGR